MEKMQKYLQWRHTRTIATVFGIFKDTKQPQPESSNNRFYLFVMTGAIYQGLDRRNRKHFLNHKNPFIGTVNYNNNCIWFLQN